MTLPIVQVDAFTSVPFAGNPAAICVLPEERSAGWMQNVAREMNLSETAFLSPKLEGFSLRWFTPAVEVDLCGHATLASAHVLWESGQLPASEAARFHTRSGLLTCIRRGEWIDMDFPATPPQAAQAPAGLLDALGVDAKYVGRSRFDYLLEVDAEATVRALRPDFARLSRLTGVRGVIVTSRSVTSERDFVSRFFAPAVGVNEDPVTGSAHCTLTPYWSSQLHKQELVAHQLSARGGVLGCRFEGARVRLSGQAVTVLRGELVA